MAAMTVRQLRETLADMPEDALVVLSKDAEGNDFSPVESAERSFSLNYYRAITTWYGEIEEGERDGLPLALIIWPTN